jgi:putative nucleotidyltransferase with HDIG domain
MTLEPKAQLYVLTVSAVGLAIVANCIDSLRNHPIPADWIVLAALTLLSGSFTIKVPKITARISVSETFVFTSVLLFGTCAGTIIVALDTLVAALRFKSLSREPFRAVFNLSAAAISIWAAGQLFYLLAGIPPLHEQPSRLPEYFLPLVVMAGSYFILNSSFVAFALALERGISAFGIWRNNFLWLSVNYFGGASVAALLVSYTRTVDLTALAIIVPLLVIPYLTFKTSFRRIEDATRHVEEVHQLYLSTIETLATAIDAKDQVTHGHIRRVQKLTLGLARELGMKDAMQLRAIEAAALLHDTGKLVVPEHILNKPGRLTPGEFEKMKLHASAGADILSAIKFPYPVVPIVRHHHENWDGTGYPDGLKTIDIPIGARILAVVDCFDALTSDRPYRHRMTDSEAMAVLLQRRGVMYDPLIVDIFIERREILTAGLPDRPEDARPTLAPISVAPTLPTPLLSRRTQSEALTVMLEAALRHTGSTFGVLFASDLESDRLVSLVAITAEGPANETLVMDLGTGVSGWVAVNATAIVNAEAALDFRRSVQGVELVRSLCVPVWVKAKVVGVLSVYSSDRRGYSDDDKTFVERLVAGLDAEAPAVAFNLLLNARRARPDAHTTVH